MRAAMLLLLACTAGKDAETADTGGTEETGHPPKDVDHDGYTADVDCDDRDAEVFPGAPEYCNGHDDDCDKEIDEAGAADATTYYRDSDMDGFGIEDKTAAECRRPKGYAREAGDCDDTRADTHPGAPEVYYDGIDQDCAGGDDYDRDGDGYPGGAHGQDCNDFDPSSTEAVFGDNCLAPYGDCNAEDFAALLLVPNEYPTIADAVTAASDGMEVCVGPGTWYEHVNFLGKDIRLIGALGASATVLDGGAEGAVVTFESYEGAGAQLAGFTITNGYAEDGGGVFLTGDDALAPNLRDLHVTGNSATDDGGGIYVHGGVPTMRDLEISDNAAGDSGGGLRVAETDVDFSGLHVHDNFAVGSGGGVAVRGSIVTIADSVIEYNTSGDNGGGVITLAAGGSWHAVTLRGNVAAGSGGGMELVQSGQSHFTRVEFWGNVSGTEGGGLRMGEGGEPDLVSVLFAGNEAGTEGGAVALDGICGWSLTNGTFVANRGGAAIVLYGTCEKGTTDANLMENAVFAYHEGTVLEARDDESIAVAWSAFYANGADAVGIEEPVGADNNLAVAPGFVSFSAALPSAMWDLHLGASSALRDAGNPKTLDGDASVADIGVYGGPFADAEWYFDADGDGMYDGWEREHALDTATDDAASDADADALTNAMELASGTDPQVADTDGDGATDGAELGAGTDPLNPAG